MRMSQSKFRSLLLANAKLLVSEEFRVKTDEITGERKVAADQHRTDTK